MSRACDFFGDEEPSVNGNGPAERGPRKIKTLLLAISVLYEDGTIYERTTKLVDSAAKTIVELLPEISAAVNAVVEEINKPT